MQWCKDQSSPTLNYSVYETLEFSTLKIPSLVKKKPVKNIKSPLRTIIAKRLRNSPDVTSVCFDAKTVIALSLKS